MGNRAFELVLSVEYAKECPVKGKRTDSFLLVRSLGPLEQELDCTVILDKRKFWIFFERHLKGWGYSYLRATQVRLSVL